MIFANHFRFFKGNKKRAAIWLPVPLLVRKLLLVQFLFILLVQHKLVGDR